MQIYLLYFGWIKSALEKAFNNLDDPWSGSPQVIVKLSLPNLFNSKFQNAKKDKMKFKKKRKKLLAFSNAGEFIFIETLVEKTRRNQSLWRRIFQSWCPRAFIQIKQNIPLKARQVRVIAFANKPRKRDKACLAFIRVINVI